jgi:hypothetical protein
VNPAKQSYRNPAALIVKYRAVDDPELNPLVVENLKGPVALPLSEIVNDEAMASFFKKRSQRDYAWRTVEYI